MDLLGPKTFMRTILHTRQSLNVLTEAILICTYVHLSEETPIKMGRKPYACHTQPKHPLHCNPPSPSHVTF